MKENIKKTVIAILKQNSLVYQSVYYCKDWLYYFLKKKSVKQFYHMSESELMQLDAKLYEKRHNKSLDWNNLKTYTEKMQWAKLFDLDPRKSLCADKYLVRDYVSQKIGPQYLIPLIGVWDKLREVDFSKLPESYVIKTNHGSGDTVIVRGKEDFSLSKKIEIKRKINISLKTDYSTSYCEMHYRNIRPCVLVEQLLSDNSSEIFDYKFLCFDGEPKFCWVDIDRFTNHTRNVYDLEWKLQSWNQRTYGNYKGVLKKPENFDEMISVARKLAQGFSHVRVDLYNIGGKIYFGEMTFTNGSGFEEIVPESADLMLGDMWNLGVK